MISNIITACIFTKTYLPFQFNDLPEMKMFLALFYYPYPRRHRIAISVFQEYDLKF